MAGIGNGVRTCECFRNQRCNETRTAYDFAGVLQLGVFCVWSEWANAGQGGSIDVVKQKPESFFCSTMFRYRLKAMCLMSEELSLHFLRFLHHDDASFGMQ
nr:hypothetical protein CFP56_22142 [Quercus suber]